MASARSLARGPTRSSRRKRVPTLSGSRSHSRPLCSNIQLSAGEFPSGERATCTYSVRVHMYIVIYDIRVTFHLARECLRGLVTVLRSSLIRHMLTRRRGRTRAKERKRERKTRREKEKERERKGGEGPAERANALAGPYQRCASTNRAARSCPETTGQGPHTQSVLVALGRSDRVAWYRYDVAQE